MIGVRDLYKKTNLYIHLYIYCRSKMKSSIVVGSMSWLNVYNHWKRTKSSLNYDWGILHWYFFHDARSIMIRVFFWASLSWELIMLIGVRVIGYIPIIDWKRLYLHIRDVRYGSCTCSLYFTLASSQQWYFSQIEGVTNRYKKCCRII